MSSRAGALPVDGARLALLSNGLVGAIPGRCVQCGICSFNCPMGIDVRRFASQGLVVSDSRCFKCGACVERCPRRTLRFEWNEAA